MPRPNNKRPNDQQRLSQEYLAKQPQPVEAGKEMYTEQVKPIASVQRKETT
ncbi:hypothetical protein LOK74_05500 [Brevibacillus humidisoli]|uniref:hypothetical protein n=1 Tax=Brevibacillus humidisoli TaxID=2895522 RepID=UPI001E587405|nr:hypothetical protein [Brevibacillus humidisoli]UFJ41958.1 hypothetical protein LOK74_05500 [Brevibacillus humidisoli]